mgnify:CR=1 FL=1
MSPRRLPFSAVVRAVVCTAAASGVARRVVRAPSTPCVAGRVVGTAPTAGIACRVIGAAAVATETVVLNHQGTARSYLVHQWRPPIFAQEPD